MNIRTFAPVVFLVLLLPPGEVSAQLTPGTDIWAFRVSGSTPSIDLSSVVRVSEQPGYDNQPHFPPGQRLILYTVIDSLGQADIWSYDIRSGERKNITRSAPESEYSATVLPSQPRGFGASSPGEPTRRSSSRTFSPSATTPGWMTTAWPCSSWALPPHSRSRP